MKMNFTKMMLFVMIVVSTISTMSSNNFLVSWMSMEINMISILPILTKSNKMKDQTMKYFIMQSMASSMMLMSMLINSTIESPINLSIMLMSSMLIKMGLVPFHLWVPMMMTSLKWETCMIMTTIQKIIPITISTQMLKMNNLILPMILSLIIAPVSAIKQLSMKKIMAFSSISNTPWMLTSMMNSKMQFSMFMVIYSTITIMMMKMMKKKNIMFINQTTILNKKKKMSMMISCLSMSGMPPTTGFLPKWMILQSTINLSWMLSSSMIMSSMMMTFVYMKMMSMSFMLSTKKKKCNKEINWKESSNIFNFLGLPTMLTLKSWL